MKRILLLIVLLFSPLVHAAGPEAAARSFYRQMVAVGELRDPQIRRQVVEQLMGDHFDFEGFYRRSLADHWGTWNSEQRETFNRAFQKKFIEHLSQNLHRLDRLTAARVSYRTVQKRGETAVIAQGQVEGTSIAVTLFLAHTGGEWKVCDLDIAGAKLSRNYRGMFSYVLRKSGFEGLLARLNKSEKVI